MPRITKEPITAQHQGLENWIFEHDSLIRVFDFEQFKQSISFVNEIANLAECANHHPDIWIRYNRVTIILKTHDQHSVTDKDIELAKKIQDLCKVN